MRSKLTLVHEQNMSHMHNKINLNNNKEKKINLSLPHVFIYPTLSFKLFMLIYFIFVHSSSPLISSRLFVILNFFFNLSLFF